MPGLVHQKSASCNIFYKSTKICKFINLKSRRAPCECNVINFIRFKSNVNIAYERRYITIIYSSISQIYIIFIGIICNTINDERNVSDKNFQVPISVDKKVSFQICKIKSKNKPMRYQ